MLSRNTQASSHGSAGGGKFHIVSVVLDNDTFDADTPDATVGEITVTMSISTFNGTLSLSGADASSFQLDGTTLKTNGSIAAGDYDINIVATLARAVNSPFVQPETLTGSASGYTAPAVHVDGNVTLSTANLTAPGDDTGYCSFAIWAGNANYGPGEFWLVDPAGTFTSYSNPTSDPSCTAAFANSDNSKSLSPATLNTVSNPTGWHIFMGSCQTNLGMGAKILNLYDGDNNLLITVQDNSDAFLMTFNGLPFFLFDDTFGDTYTGDASNWWIAPGQYIDFSIEANRRKFVDANGKPVYLGANGEIPTGTAPAMFFSGDAATFGQPNLGTGGAFTLSGSLTNATTSPSD